MKSDLPKKSGRNYLSLEREAIEVLSPIVGLLFIFLSATLNIMGFPIVVKGFLAVRERGEEGLLFVRKPLDDQVGRGEGFFLTPEREPGPVFNRMALGEDREAGSRFRPREGGLR